MLCKDCGKDFDPVEWGNKFYCYECICKYHEDTQYMDEVALKEKEFDEKCGIYECLDRR